jgi:hydrogenase maturation protein HypF
LIKEETCPVMGCTEWEAEMDKARAVDIEVFGVVQGVGFRPFVFRTACELGYTGWVKNTGPGVEIHLESELPTDFADFLQALEHEKPPLSQIETLSIKPAQFRKRRTFLIEKTTGGESFVFISPDISVCENCRKEMLTPEDRRYLYPFINCTDCGPRYTIVESLPYDRDKTTMKDFALCPDCSREYSDPMDRRYHAQPVACPVCGPHVTLINSKTQRPVKGGIEKAASLIMDGHILSVKGLGGYHLVCDTRNDAAIERLRALKARKVKPLALMARNLQTVQRFAHVSPEEKAQLLSARRPIVLLQRKRDLPGIAPGLNEVGFMLPYTPLHHLLLRNLPLIVATSSNRKDSPIMKDEEEGIFELCDYILTHNRPIRMRADDSVMKVVEGKPLFLRRARGYVPYPQAVPEELKGDCHILAVGGELKDTISIYKNGYVVTSQFLGDLDEYQNYQYFEETIEHLRRLFQVKPRMVVSDLHPDFHTTRYAQRLNIPHLQVQHHYAHVLAAMLEHRIPPGKKIFGVSWDGFGYGDDGKPWGGEFLIADYADYDRFAHFQPVALPGGDLAAKQPWRMALAYLLDAYGEDDLPEVDALKNVDPNLIRGVREMIERRVNSPLASSCGRLFDAVSFLVGLAPLRMEFEAEAPMLLEAAASARVKSSYGFDIDGDIVSFNKTIRAIVADLGRGRDTGTISSRFHYTLACVILEMADKARQKHKIDTVALVGGVFLNKKLLQTASLLLQHGGFEVIRPVKYSPNDESISVGQIAYALSFLK